MLQYKGRLAANAEVNLLHVLRAPSNRHFNWYQVADWLKGDALQRLDLRTLEDALQRCGHDDPARATADICFAWNSPLGQIDPERVWPFFAEHPEFIEEAFGLRPAPGRYSYSVATTLTLLEQFPVLPVRFIPVLLELALGSSKTNRAEAQQLLETLPDIGDRAVEALASSKQEIRTLAAEWLQRLGYREAIPALKATLAKESAKPCAPPCSPPWKASAKTSPATWPRTCCWPRRTKACRPPPASLAWLDLTTCPPASGSTAPRWSRPSCAGG